MSLSDANCVAYELMPWFVVVLIDPMSFIDLEPSDRTVLRLSFFSLTPQLISMYVFLSLSHSVVSIILFAVFLQFPLHMSTVPRLIVGPFFVVFFLRLSLSHSLVLTFPCSNANLTIAIAKRVHRLGCIVFSLWF